MLNPDPIAWELDPTGRRHRLWCKICRDQGQPWILGVTCSHVIYATNERTIPRAEAMATLEKYKSWSG